MAYIDADFREEDNTSERCGRDGRNGTTDTAVVKASRRRRGRRGLSLWARAGFESAIGGGDQRSGAAVVSGEVLGFWADVSDRKAMGA